MTGSSTNTSFRTPDGVTLHVNDSGGSGLPFLFQHGLCGDTRQTSEIFSGSPEVRRITLEMRGHGASEAGAAQGISIASFTDDCLGSLRHLQLSSIVVGGISMGAAIAMRLAVTSPSLVRALVIARPAWGTAASPPNMQPNAEVGALLQRLPADEAAAEFANSTTAKRLAVEAPDNLASLRSFFTRPEPETTAMLLTRISADGPGITRDQLQRLKIPTLIVATRADDIHPFAMAEDIASLIPAARLVEITPKAHDRGRHITEFRACLNSFLKGLPS